MPTKAELEKRIAQLEGELQRARKDRDEVIVKFLTMERILIDVPTEVPTRTSGEPYTYIDARKHLIEQIKTRMIG